MNTVPLDLQRRCEQRWAAGYQRLQESASTPEHRPQKQDQQQGGRTRNAKQKPTEFSGWFEVIAPAV
jgi:hypothetical protein